MAAGWESQLRIPAFTFQITSANTLLLQDLGETVKRNKKNLRTIQMKYQSDITGVGFAGIS